MASEIFLRKVFDSRANMAKTLQMEPYPDLFSSTTQTQDCGLMGSATFTKNVSSEAIMEGLLAGHTAYKGEGTVMILDSWNARASIYTGMGIAIVQFAQKREVIEDNGYSVRVIDPNTVEEGEKALEQAEVLAKMMAHFITPKQN